MQPPGLVTTVIPDVGSDGFFSGMTAGNYSFFANANTRTFYVIQNGNIVWQKSATYPTMISGTDAGIVYVGWMENGSSPGTLEAYNFTTGELLWTHNVGFASYFIKTDAAGNLLFSQQDFVGANSYGPTRLVKLDPNTGQEIWSVYPYGNTPDNPGPAFSSVSPVAVGVDGYYYAPYGFGEVIKYNVNGVEQWRAPVPLDTQSVYESNGSVVAVGILNPGYDSVITRIDSVTGQVQSELTFNTTMLGFGPEISAVWGMDVLVQGDAIYVSGILHNNSLINPAMGNSEVFVAKFSLTMNLVWTFTFGGDGEDSVGSRGTSLTLDADGSFTVFSTTTSSSVSGIPLQGSNFIMYKFRDDPGVLVGTAQADIVQGTVGADLINTGAGNDVVNAGAGADLIIGGSGAGNDTYDGGAGVDTVRYTSATAGIVVNLSATSNHARSVGAGDAAGIGVDQLFSIENIIAGNFDDLLTGNSANNDIDGQNGIDTVYMSGSRSSYNVIKNLDGSYTITDNRAGSPDGVDTYRNIERFTFTDVTVDAAGLLSPAPSGTNGNDTFLASAARETFNGLLGTDTVSYERATAAVIASLNSPVGNTGFAQGDTYNSIENLTGSNFNDRLTGDSNNNLLTGRIGADTLVGLAGNDTYIVNLTTAGALEDTVTEATNAGTDGIILEGATGSAASITLSANLENLDGSRTGTRSLNLAGNSSANVIKGNSAANTITGGTGADNMDGGDGSDLYILATTADYATGEVINDSGKVNSDSDELRYTGTAATTLTLNSSLLGVERVVIGTGSAQSAVTTGTGAINVNSTAVLNGLTIVGNNGANNITGTAFSDTITANSGNDTINGGAGADRLFGGLGNDTLIGGAGADSFIFNTAPNNTNNRDNITDFNIADDTIELENAIFTALGITTGVLNASAFVNGSAALDASDRIIYNSSTGALLYDSNGNGSGGSFQIATLATGLSLTNNDFLII